MVWNCGFTNRLMKFLRRVKGITRLDKTINNTIRKILEVELRRFGLKDYLMNTQQR